MEREKEWSGYRKGNLYPYKERSGFVREAMRAAIAAGILILLALVLMAGVFGADYGVRKAYAQTRDEIESIMSAYGLSEEQREMLYQEMLERLREMISSGELQFAGSFSEEDARLLRVEMEKHMEETLLDYVTSEQLQEMLEEIMNVLQQDIQGTEELLAQLNQMYEQYITIQEQQLANLQEQITELRQMREIILQELEERLEKELASIWETISDIGKVYNSGLEDLAEKLRQEIQERSSKDQSIAEMLESYIQGASAEFGELLRRIIKNEADIETVFQLVSNGKALLASTITDEGVETAADVTFETMAENIRKLARLKYEEGKSAARLTAQYIVNATAFRVNDWSNNSYTAPQSGSCWIIGYFLIVGEGGGSGNDVEVDVWIEQSGKRIYSQSVRSYIPGAGNNAYICHVQQQAEVKKGDRFLLGFHIESGSAGSGGRGKTGSVERITISLLYPQDAGTSPASLQDFSTVAVWETQQEAVAKQITEDRKLQEAEKEEESDVKKPTADAGTIKDPEESGTEQTEEDTGVEEKYDQDKEDESKTEADKAQNPEENDTEKSEAETDMLQNTEESGAEEDTK